MPTRTQLLDNMPLHELTAYYEARHRRELLSQEQDLQKQIESAKQQLEDLTNQLHEVRQSLGEEVPQENPETEHQIPVPGDLTAQELAGMNSSQMVTAVMQRNPHPMSSLQVAQQLWGKVKTSSKSVEQYANSINFTLRSNKKLFRRTERGVYELVHKGPVIRENPPSAIIVRHSQRSHSLQRTDHPESPINAKPLWQFAQQALEEMGGDRQRLQDIAHKVLDLGFTTVSPMESFLPSLGNAMMHHQDVFQRLGGGFYGLVGRQAAVAAE